MSAGAAVAASSHPCESRKPRADISALAAAVRATLPRNDRREIVLTFATPSEGWSFDSGARRRITHDPVLKSLTACSRPVLKDLQATHAALDAGDETAPGCRARQRGGP